MEASAVVPQENDRHYLLYRGFQLRSNFTFAIYILSVWACWCKVSLTLFAFTARAGPLEGVNVIYYNVYSVIRIQLCTWTTILQSTVLRLSAESIHV